MTYEIVVGVICCDRNCTHLLIRSAHANPCKIEI